MAWLLLAAAIAVEVLSSSALKLATISGSAGVIYTVAALGGVVLSYGLMAWALHLQMEISLAYAIWSGVGTAAIAIIGTTFFGESINMTKALALILTVAGVALLQAAERPEVTTFRPGTASATPALAEAMRGLSDALMALPGSAPACALSPADPTRTQPAASGHISRRPNSYDFAG
jgi:small multidrug resistance pump